MGITSAIVLFAVIWFMTFLVVLPLGLQTQAEAGEIVPGTHGSSPANLQMRRKVRLTSLWAAGIWVVVAGTILSGLITVRDLDWFNRMATPEVSLTDETDG
ncbi:MAG: DUF1467 family protein [Yoonia sp.]|jgi:predicted secreted protein|nr:DUF1467 family protein [Yoonia sp.]MDG1519645.1 DUF1467 family protein [Yoonia sp.]MDG1769162.1 DUF1467 family protein [Yoonia sp.]MDG1868396.1 DUF1467 family protein [Yoonia sp.]